MDFVSTKFIFAAIVLFSLLVYWVFNFIILYHLTRFGIGTQPKKFSAIFLLGSIVIFFVCISLFNSLDLVSLKQELANLGTLALNFTYQR